MTNHQRRRPDYLRLVKPNYVQATIAMVQRFPLESLVCYLLVAAQEREQLGTLTPALRARVLNEVGKIMKEIDRAA